MADIIKLLIVFIAVLVMLRKKLGVGVSLLAGSGLLMAFYLMSPGRIWSTITSALTSPVTVKLLLSLSFILMFEMVMREKNALKNIMDSMRGLLRNRRAVIISMPLLIGMLPSIGGAYFSAPMVAEATAEIDMTPEEKAFINYWYRHPWEYILPLYPGIILASALARVSASTFMFLNLAYSLTLVAAGAFYGLHKARGTFPGGLSFSMRGLLSLTPIAALLFLVIGFHIELHYALLIVIALLLLVYRYRPKDIFRVLRKGISKDVIILIVGVMIFKETLEFSGAVENLSRSLTMMRIPLLPLVFILPFSVGILTGITVGAIGSTFPLFMNMAGTNIHLLSFAFASAFIGVLLSPVHVCLILSREYFKADLWQIYRKIIPASAAILTVALLEYYVFRS